MVEVTLRTYCDEIESLIDEGAYDAAISHCQHILKVHPKYLRVYRLMGKTALEMGDLEAASDLFSRLLSMDPEDFVARVGLSVASDREGALDQAVWHMERAFELAPDNQAIIAELRQLYGRRDGVEPEKVPLTRGALARLHARGNLYTQAINELRQLLKIELDRVDLQVALAETLWRANRRIEAAEASLALVERIPYCLKANLILGEIWSSSGRDKEGTAHLNRARMIDPENKTAYAVFGERSPLAATEVNIGRMEYVAPPAVEEQEPDWLQTLIDEGAGAVTADEAVPEWLHDVAAAAGDQEAALPDKIAPEAAPAPEWLQQVAEAAGAEAEKVAAAPEIPLPEPAEGETPDWLAQLTAEPSETAAEPPALEEMAERVEAVAAEAVEEPEMISDEAADFALAEAGPADVEELEAAAPELPDWLAEMAPAEAEIADIEVPEPTPEELPEWLAEMAPAEAEALEAAEPEPTPGELPDWLTEMAEAEGEAAEAEDLGLAPAEIPDWVTEMAPPDATSAEVPDLDVEPAEAPDWLAEEDLLQAEQPEVELLEEEIEEIDIIPEAPVTAETSDWLSELVEAAGATLDEEELLADQPPEWDEEALPDWLAELDEERRPEAEVPAVRAEEGEPEEEFLEYLEGEGEAVAESEAELLAQLEDMSPEEAFAAWEAMLAESEKEEELAPELEAELPEAPAPTGAIVIEEPEKEILVYPEGAGGEVTESEAELLAQLEDMSPEEAFAAWEAMLAESEEPAPVEAAPAPEMIAEAEETWMPMAEDEGLEEIEMPLVAEAALAAEPEAELDELEIEVAEEARLVEPVAELDQAWMPLAEDEALAEAEAPPEPEEVLIADELPEWAVTEAAEIVSELPEEEEEIELGPDWVLMTEEEEGEVRMAEALVAEAPVDVSEPSPEELEPVVEELVYPDEEPFVEVEPSARPTWVALEEEPAAEALEEVPTAEALEEVPLAEALEEVPTIEVLEEAPTVEALAPEAPVAVEKAPEPMEDQARLELARRLWNAGQKDEACTEFEDLVRSPIRTEVIADLEEITADEPSEEPMFRLLGDAYVRENRLQDALKAYRRALTILSTPSG